MSNQDVLSHEDDLFGRIALFNKFVTLNQIIECGRIISAEVIAELPKRSLASILIDQDYLSAQRAKAVQAALNKRSVAVEGVEPPAAEGLEPAPKPMQERAPAGDSRIQVAIEAGKDLPDKRFRLEESGDKRSATLNVQGFNLFAADSPAFEASCRRLLQTGRKRLTIDIREVQHVASVIIGDLGKINIEALAEGRRLLVRTSPQTAKIVQMILGGSVKTLTD